MNVKAKHIEALRFRKDISNYPEPVKQEVIALNRHIIERFAAQGHLGAQAALKRLDAERQTT